MSLRGRSTPRAPHSRRERRTHSAAPCCCFGKTAVAHCHQYGIKGAPSAAATADSLGVDSHPDLDSIARRRRAASPSSAFTEGVRPSTCHGRRQPLGAEYACRLGTGAGASPCAPSSRLWPTGRVGHSRGSEVTGSYLYASENEPHESSPAARTGPRNERQPASAGTGLKRSSGAQTEAEVDAQDAKGAEHADSPDFPKGTLGRPRRARTGRRTRSSGRTKSCFTCESAVLVRPAP